MQKQFIAAINQIADEKNIPKEVILETVEDALAAAYKKDYGHREQEVRVDLDEQTGDTRVFVIKEVVEKEEDIENKFLQISLAEAKKIKKDAKAGETVDIEDFPQDFGRIAAQTAKQVIIQRIREAERDIMFAEYKDKESELINAIVQRIEGNTVIVDLGRASGVLFSNEQVPGERYYIGQRIKVFIVKVEQSTKGPQVVVSRSHPGVVRKIFELEVPEITSGIVEVKSIAREAGHRTKMAVSSNEDNVDPVGSCVGQRGIRVQSVMAELGEEKIDIILWDEDPKAYITNALSPAKVVEIELNESEKRANVKVPEDQLSLAIGKQGQNVRLAAKLTGWNIDIEGADSAGIKGVEEAASATPEAPKDLEDEILKAVEGGENEKKSAKNNTAEKTEKETAKKDEVPEIEEISEKNEKPEIKGDVSSDHNETEIVAEADLAEQAQINIDEIIEDEIETEKTEKSQEEKEIVNQEEVKVEEPGTKEEKAEEPLTAEPVEREKQKTGAETKKAEEDDADLAQQISDETDKEGQVGK